MQRRWQSLPERESNFFRDTIPLAPLGRGDMRWGGSLAHTIESTPIANPPTVLQSDRETVAYSLAALDDQTVIRIEVPGPT
jgi:hypothetical protein